MIQSVSEILSTQYSIAAVPGRKCTCPFCGKKSFSIKSNDEYGRCFHPSCGKFLKFIPDERGRGVSHPRNSRNHATVRPASGCTLDAYSSFKKIPVDFLKRIGLTEITYMSMKVVRMPYYDESGKEAAIRFRVALSKSPDGDNRFKWKKGAKLIPYGLFRLPEARKKKYIALIEGESDTHTLWFHDIPALGIPGAQMWKEAWSLYLDGIEKIYVSVEPDSGGEAVIKWLSNCSFKDRVHLLDFGDDKDPSGLYLLDPDNFRTAWTSAVECAIPFKEHERIYVERRKSELWDKCRHIAESPDILHLVVSALESFAVVGESRNLKLIYLALTSRLFDKIVSIVLKAQSATGKSYIVHQCLRLFPESAYYVLSSMSERALVYSEEPLKHRMLVICEFSGASGDLTSYFIRSLLSEGYLRYETVESIGGKLKPRLIIKEGPTGLIITTTAFRVHPENETRLLSLSVSDSPEQTRNILKCIASGSSSSSVDLEPFIAFQEWLALNSCEVVIPFASNLADLVPPVATRLRRDFSLVLSLIRAHALLHQAVRNRNEQGKIIATDLDYAVIRELISNIISQGVDSTVSHTIRETISTVEELLRISETVSARDVAKHLKIHKSNATRRIQMAISEGYLLNDEERKRKPYRLRLGEPLPDDIEILPSPDVLFGCTVAPDSGEVHPPPSPELPVDVSTWPEVWREKYEERAAILEHEGGLSSQEAENEAVACIRSEFHNSIK